MEFLQLKINSTKPYYTNEQGKIYNQFFKELKLSAINGSLFLKYILNDGKQTTCTTPISRLIYSTYFPKHNIDKCNIFRKKLNIENPYQIGNLKKVLKSRMPIQNKLPALHKSKTNPIKRKFYEKLSSYQFNLLVVLCRNKKLKNTVIAGLFSVNKNTISKNRPFLIKSKLKPV